MHRFGTKWVAPCLGMWLLAWSLSAPAQTAASGTVADAPAAASAPATPVAAEPTVAAPAEADLFERARKPVLESYADWRIRNDTWVGVAAEAQTKTRKPKPKKTIAAVPVDPIPVEMPTIKATGKRNERPETRKNPAENDNQTGKSNSTAEKNAVATPVYFYEFSQPAFLMISLATFRLVALSSTNKMYGVISLK